MQVSIYLLSIKLEEGNPKLNKKQIFQHLFPREVYDALKFNNITSDVLQLLHDFLAYQRFREATFLNRLQLVQALFKRGLTKQFERLTKSWKKKRTKKESPAPCPIETTLFSKVRPHLKDVDFSNKFTFKNASGEWSLNDIQKEDCAKLITKK